MMDLPVISVIMPMYNAHSYVADAIESVFRQDYPTFELIVVDDGSTDSSHEIVERFDDPRIRLTRTENRGLAAARNLGIARSQGAYVTFLDSDDLLLPRSLSSRLAGFERHDADCVFSRNVTVRDVFTRSEWQKPTPQPVADSGGIWSAEDLIYLFLEGRFYVFAQAFLIPRQTLLAVGGFDEQLKIAEDVEFFTRLLPVCRLLVETLEPFYIYRRTANSLSAINSRKKAAAKLQAVRQAYRNLAPYLSGREKWIAQTLFSSCVEGYPYWTEDHRVMMEEARRLRGDEPFDLACVGGPRAQAVAGLLGWRAGRLSTFASSFLRHSLRRLRASG